MEEFGLEQLSYLFYFVCHVPVMAATNLNVLSFFHHQSAVAHIKRPFIPANNEGQQFVIEGVK